MKIICVGRNYVDHAKELGNTVPEEPVLFMKPKTALLNPGMFLSYPAFTNELHYECELVIKITKNGKLLQARQSKYYYEEVSLGIDFTARDFQNKLKKKGLPWEKAKAFDHSAAVGEFIHKSEIDLATCRFSLNKNGERVQDGNAKDMIFSVDEIIAEASQYFTLNIGDLIFTGTPAGVGECVIGDLLEGELEGQRLLSVEIR